MTPEKTAYNPNAESGSQRFSSGLNELKKEYKLVWKTFQPKKPREEKPDVKEEIIYNPGWAGKAKGRSTHLLLQAIADASGIAVTALEVQGNPRTLTPEQVAVIVEKYIEDKGLNRVTIIGQSAGVNPAVIEAINLKKKNIEVRALGLINPTSMYDQKKWKFLGNFIKDSLIETNKLIKKSQKRRRKIARKQAFRAAADLVPDFARQVWVARGVLKGVDNLSRPMINRSQLFGELDMPIALIQGKSDRLSNPLLVFEQGKDISTADRKEFVPEDMFITIMDKKTRERDEESMRAYGTELQKRINLLNVRGDRLRQLYFTKSPKVTMLVGEELGVHGMTIMRPHEAGYALVRALGLDQTYRMKPQQAA